MVFTQGDIALLASFLFGSYFPIAHRSPWGLWTTQQRQWYRADRSKYGGPPDWLWGTLFLFEHAFPAIGSFLFFRAYDVDHQSITIASFILVMGIVALRKVWEALFFDYRDSRGAAYVAWGAVLLYIPLLVLVIITASNGALGLRGQGWTACALFAVHMGWLVYVASLSLYWQMYAGMTRKEAQRALVTAKGMDMGMGMSTK